MDLSRIIFIICLNKCDAYLVFDRYYDNSIKAATRNARAGKDVQICDGQFADRYDLHTTYEEADVVIIQQAVHLAATGINSIRVVADDTDEFVLLLYYYTTQQL